MDEVEEKLSEDEVIFIEAYLHNGFNAGEAYKAISPACTQSTANSQGSRFAKKLKETQYFRNKLHEIRNNYGLSMKTQIERLNSVYFKSMQGKAKLEFDREAKQMIEKLDENGNIIYEFDSRGAVAAIQEQNKMLGFHKDSRLRDSESKEKIAQFEKELEILKTQKMTADTYLQALKALKE